MKKKTLKDYYVINLPIWQLEERGLDDLSVLNKMAPKELYALAKELTELPADKQMMTDDYGEEIEMGAAIFDLDELPDSINTCDFFVDTMLYYYMFFIDKDDLK